MLEKNRRHSKTMTENGLDIQTTSTRRTGFQTAPVLLLGQMKEKTHPSHFLKILFDDPHCTYLVLPNTEADPSQNQKSANLLHERYLEKLLNLTSHEF